MNATPFRRFAFAFIVAGLLAVIAQVGVASAQPMVDDDPQDQAQLANIRFANNLFDAVLNGNDPAAAASLVAEDAVIDTQFGEFHGPEGVLEFAAIVRANYPDASFRITSISVTDTSAVVGWSMTGTRIEMDTFGRVTNVPVELGGAYTFTADATGITHLTTQSGYVVVAEPPSDAASLPPEIAGRGQPS